MLAGGTIFWRSVKQIIIVSSTITVEFIACFETSNHKIWLKNFIIGLLKHQPLSNIKNPLILTNVMHAHLTLVLPNKRAWIFLSFVLTKIEPLFLKRI
jgi:hypothetical protein